METSHLCNWKHSVCTVRKLINCWIGGFYLILPLRNPLPPWIVSHQTLNETVTSERKKSDFKPMRWSLSFILSPLQASDVMGRDQWSAAWKHKDCWEEKKRESGKAVQRWSALKGLHLVRKVTLTKKGFLRHPLVYWFGPAYKINIPPVKPRNAYAFK